MHQDIPKPVVVIAIIAVVVLAIYFGKSALSEPPQPSKEEKAKFMPSWIDPATYKPRVGAMPGTGGAGQPKRSSDHNEAGASSLPK